MTDNYGHMQPSHCKVCKEQADDCECQRNNRLLSEQDCQRIFQEVYGKEEAKIEAIHTFIEAIAAAQLAKADREWVEWVVAHAEVEGDAIILSGTEWQSRRKEIGI